MNFEHRIERVPESGCWIWMGTITGRGYGNVRIDSRYIGAHRAVYQHLRGQIPRGHELDHLCRVRCCVNPEHLEAVTHQVNMMRSFAATKTHCKYGHEITKENTEYVSKGGDRRARRCKKCQREAMVRYYWRKKVPDEA